MSTRYSKIAYSLALSVFLVVPGMVACGSDEVDAEDQGADTGGTGGASSSASTVPATGVSTTGGMSNSTASAPFGRGGSSTLATTKTNNPFPSAGAAGATRTSGGMLATGGTPSTAGASSVAPTCVSGKACTAGCSATCLNNASANYSCTCTGGKLDCDVQPCVGQAGGCVDGSTCSKDCISTCPGDASTTYTCSCSGGRLSCDSTSCFGDFGDAVCPAINSDGLPCDDSQISTCTPPAGSSEMICLCVQGGWWCL